MEYPFAYGVPSRSGRVAILSRSRQYTFGHVRPNKADDGATWLAFNMLGQQVTSHSFVSRDWAAKAVAQWGYDNVKREPST